MIVPQSGCLFPLSACACGDLVCTLFDTFAAPLVAPPIAMLLTLTPPSTATQLTDLDGVGLPLLDGLLDGERLRLLAPLVPGALSSWALNLLIPLSASSIAGSAGRTA